MYLARKYLLGTHLLLEMGMPFYVVIRAQEGLAVCRPKAVLFSNPEYWSGLMNQNIDLLLCSPVLT